jgi:hypothetical protein
MPVITVASVTPATITVPATSPFAVGPDAIVIKDQFMTYESYNSATGLFVGVVPNPISLGVTVGDVIEQATQEQKRVNSAYERLLSKFPKRYQVKGTKYLKALLQALAKGDGFIDYEVEAVRDNLLVMSAIGKYLDRLAGQYGVVRGQGSGVQDPDFRKLVPLVGMSPKQITNILNKVIDVVYGPFASHANVTCSLPEPYNFQNGWSLLLVVDGRETQVKFQSSDFASISNASAEEVANIITQRTDGKVTGQVITNVRTGEKFVNIRTSTVGAQGFIRVLGGECQSKMRFPIIRPTIMSSAVWNVVRVGGTDEVEFQLVSGLSPAMKNAGVQAGDYVTIRPDSGFNVANAGSFEVTYADNNVFRVKNPTGVPESGITNVNMDDFTFFQSRTANILLSSRPATVIETAPNELTVILPVTSPLVKRTLKGSHHLRGGLTNCISVTSNTVELGSSAEFPADGGCVQPTSSRNTARGIVSAKTSTTISLISAEGWPTRGAVWSQVTGDFYYYSGISGNTLTGVSPSPPNSIISGECKYSERYSFTAISGNTLTGVYPDPVNLLNREVTQGSSQLVDEYEGSFLYDLSAPFIGASENTTISEQIDQGSARTVIQVGNVSDFPDKGYIVFRFGEDGQEGPVRYQAKVGTEALVIDPGHVFKNTHRSGAGIRLVRKIGSYIPRATGDDLAVYLTSTSPARDLIANYLRSIAASGVKVKFEIRIPDQKWEVLPNLYTTIPLDNSLVPP